MTTTKRQFTRVCRCCGASFQTSEPRHTLCEKCAWEMLDEKPAVKQQKEGDKDE